MRLATPLSALKSHYDVVVVGSGYGGGVTASRLARAGRKVCVLERGREYPTGSFPSRFPDLRKELMVSGGRFGVAKSAGLYDFRYGDDIHVLTGCGLGGGSLVNAGVALRPDARVFDDAAFPKAFRSDRDGLDEGFRRAAAWIRPMTDPRAEDMPKFKALAAASHALGQAPELAPVAVSYAETVNPAGIRQPACTRCGDCCGGCNVGAKNTVAMSYLPDAARHGAELFTEVNVQHLSRAAGGLWTVHFSAMGAPKDAGTVTADIVMLSAGTLGSTEILLNSREHGLALSDRLGERFSANGDIIAFGYNGKSRVHAIGIGHPGKPGLGPVGAAVSGEIRVDDQDVLENSLCVQEGVLPSALGPLLPMMFVPGGKLIGAAEALIRGVYEGPLSRTHTFFVVSHDSASGRIVLKDGIAAITWANAGDEPVFARVDDALQKLSAASGASYVKSPLATSMLGKRPATAHPLGEIGRASCRERVCLAV